MNRFFKSILIIFMLTLLTIPSSTVLNNNAISVEMAELNTRQITPMNALQSSSFFLNVNVNNTNPNPSQAINVSSVIYDSNSIKNASLFWSYDSINSTLFNASMNPNSIPIDSQNSFPNTDYVFANGTQTTTIQNRMFGFYSFYFNDSSYISNFGASVSAGGGNTLLYVKIESSNSQGLTWNTIYENGNISSTVGINTVNLNNFNITSGYRIYAVSYKNKNPSAPSLSVSLSKDYYSSVIPASHKPTKVTYYLKAYNTLNTLSQTNNYYVFMHSPLSISINKVPTNVSGNSFYVNLSINSPDGLNYIDQPSVKAYYYIEGISNLTSSLLTLNTNTSSKSAIFDGNIDVSSLISSKNQNLTLYFQAQELISGSKTNAIRTSTLKVLLIGNPSLASTQPTSINQSNNSTGTGQTSSKNGKSPWNEPFTLFGLFIIGIVALRKRKTVK